MNKAALLLRLASAPILYWTLDAVCRLSDHTGGYTGDLLRLCISFTIPFLPFAHSRHASHSHERKERT